MLLEINVENFKSIRSLRYPINKLNILVGPNSSGKTSVLQSIALLKQSLTNLDFNGSLVELGNFKDVVYKHDDKAKITFAFAVSARIADSSFLQNLICIVEISGDKERKPLISRSTIVQGQNKQIIDFKKGRYIYDDSKKAYLGEVISDFKNISFETRGILPYASSGSGNEIEIYNEMFKQIKDDLTNYLYYLSARRGYCNTSELSQIDYSKRPDDVGKLGENTIPVLAHIQSDHEYSESMEKIRFWQKKFGLTESVAALVEGKEATNFSLKVKNETTGIQSRIVDVGFGLNQLFPVIVQCFYAPKGSLILIEQPEAHLHPRYQADVADFLIDVIDYGNRVMVETHSEHLLLRLQRRIAEKKISSKYVNFNYFDLDSKGTKTSEMRVDENGYFIGAIPEGFFEEGFQEAFAHIKAIQSQGGKNESNQ